MKLALAALAFALTAAASQAQSSELKSTTPLAASAQTAVPALVPYSGTIPTADGKPAVSTGITFLIYKDEQGGEPLFAETQSITPDALGHYQVQLGASRSSGIPAELFATGEARWLEVQIAGEKPQPRTLLASVPYALKAADAATLGGLPASAFALAGNRTPAAVTTVDTSGPSPNATTTVTTTGGTTGKLARFSGSSTIVNSILFDTGTAVGINTTTPAAPLDVNGQTVLRGDAILYRTTDATSAQGANSRRLIFSPQVYNSSTKALVKPMFDWQAEPVGNNTSAPSATLNLLATNGVTALAETGLSIKPNGVIHFAAGQTFPGTAAGDITGVTAGTGLTGGGTSGSVTLKVAVPLVLSGDNATGVIQGVDTGNGNGVYGKSASGFGVSGEGASFGVSGNSSGNIGVYGTGPYAGVSSYGGSYGVLSTAYNPSGMADGIHTTGANGVYAIANRAGGNGVYAISQNGSSSDYAIWGVSSSGYAGVFSGNVSIGGTLTKSAGTFKIDHPLDPENKYLSHSFVESPDMMNIYNGIAALDANGEATVQMPDYFAALNKDYRYQLTAIGAPGPNLYIAEEIANNRFKIAGGKGGMKVSWQVTGIRQDAYANAHRTPIEEDKPGKEKGTYLHPELFGQPEEKGREWAIHPETMKRSNKTARNRSPSPRQPGERHKTLCRGERK